MTAKSLWFETARLAGGWAERVRIELDEGLIRDVQTGVERRADEPACGAAVPGLPNLHSHAFQRGMAGLAEVAGPESDNFWTWREAMYRFVDRLTPQDNAAIAAFAFAEMLEAGFTRVGEFHYLHNDVDGRPYADPAEMAHGIVEAAGAAGIGLTLLPVFYAHAGFGGAAPAAGQRRFITDVPAFARLLEASRTAAAGLPDAVVGVAPHSLRAVTPDELAEVAALGDGPIHIHAAEQVREVEDCLAWSKARPVEWLLANAPVDENWCLVHATHMTPQETQDLARRGAVAGLCPVTEANLGDGVFPADAYLAGGGVFGVGTDSNVLIDAAGELRALEYAQRLTRRARNVLAGAPGKSTGAELFARALAGGARALGVEGGLAAGQAADIVALDLEHPSLAGRRGDRLIDSWVFASRRSPVRHVWRRGAQVVKDGRHVARERLEAGYREVLGRLLG